MGLNGRSFSPLAQQKLAYCGGVVGSFEGAARVVIEMVGLEVSANEVRSITLEVGRELEQQRDEKTEAYWRQPMPRWRATQPASRLALAVVSVDGSRIQTREAGAGHGVYGPHWREPKNAIFLRMSGVSFSEDPCPELPDCFRNRDSMQSLLSDLGEASGEGESQDDSSCGLDSWRPKPLYRTCLSSLHDSEQFGRMMEAEADSRGFYRAEKRAFVADGLPYNWSIHARHFREFTPIVDFIHVVEHLYEAAGAIYPSADARWEAYCQWASACWQGDVESVIEALASKAALLGPVAEDADQDHPSRVLACAVGYLRNNASRMHYPEYRAEGLPITSAHMESYVNQLNDRVKATRKFWNDGASAEGMLCLKSTMLCDGERFQEHMAQRPGRPFNRNVKRDPAPTLSV